MKKQFSIFLLLFFVSTNINAEISGVNIGNLTQLYNNQISKVLVGNKLFGHYDDGLYRGPVEEIHSNELSCVILTSWCLDVLRIQIF